MPLVRRGICRPPVAPAPHESLQNDLSIVRPAGPDLLRRAVCEPPQVLDVVAFDRTRMTQGLRVPHMGWAETWASSESQEACSSVSHWARALDEDGRFYYVHSFHLRCDHDRTAILRSHHGYEFAAGVGEANVVGFQFHPEKSHTAGLTLLKNFLDWDGACS